MVSARGGIGKSVVATNLAAAMAKLSDSVTLLDFSLNPGDFAVMLDDVPRNNIMDAVQQGGALDAEYLNNTLPCIRGCASATWLPPTRNLTPRDSITTSARRSWRRPGR